MSYFTFNDSIQNLVDYLGGNYQDSSQRELRRAAVSAYRELIDCYQWRSLHKLLTFPLQAHVTTGTVVYTQSTGYWVFSGTTLPSWVTRGKILIGGNSWSFQRQIDAVTMQAPADFNPGSDIASTTFELYLQDYLLPTDFRSIDVGMATQCMATRYTNISDITWMGRQRGMAGSPWGYTITADRFLPGRQTITLNPWPASADTYMALYRYRPRELKYTGYASRDRNGSVSLSGTTVTGNGTAFESGQEGSIIRISNNATTFPSDNAGDNPYYYEGVIDHVVSPTSLTVLDNPQVLAISGVKYTISDPVALPQYMLNAYLRCCEKQAEIVRQRDDGGKQSAVALFMDALETAYIGDRFTFENMSLLERSGYNNPLWLQYQTRPADIN